MKIKEPIKSSSKGFTLIELLIVVAIIGILAAVGAAVIPGILENAKVAAAKEYHSHIFKQLSIELMTCEHSTTGHSSSGYVACNLQGVNLAKSLNSASLGELLGYEHGQSPLGEYWLMYTPASGLNNNVINARNKRIGRAYIYEIPGYCFGIVTTLGDDLDVIQNSFCRE